MDSYIESGLRDAIFRDPNFIERFLSGPTDKLQAIEEYCRTNNSYYKKTGEWSLPKRFSVKTQLYRPIVDILNTIKKAVDDVCGSTSAVVESSDKPPKPQRFIDNHLNAIDSDLTHTSNIKPDLVLFQDSSRHWEDVRMLVEIKKLPGHQKAGMKQLSRYACAVFSHQLHRRHLYSMMVCGTEVTFVRFDRSGVLYSRRINIVEEAEEFTRAFASLLMLDRADEGLDPAFTFERDENGRLVYYVDLPESELIKLPANSISSNGKVLISAWGERMRRFKVIKRIYHRKSICGRATIVLRIQEVLDPDQGSKPVGPRKTLRKGAKTREPAEYALKLIWRNPQAGAEGKVLEEVHGRYGLAQYAGHWDVSMPGKCRCPEPVAGRCKNPACVDMTVVMDGLEVCNNLANLDIIVPDEVDGNEGRLREVDTTEHRTTSYQRPLRAYSYVLMESIGVPIWQAESPHQYLTAVMDAILGKDISEGNVMLLSKDQKFARRAWKEPRKRNPLPQDKVLAESEKMLRKVLKELGHRNPTGMLMDFDCHARHYVPADPSESVQSRPITRSTRRREEDVESIAPSPKRRKVSSQHGVCVAPNEPTEQEDEKPDVKDENEGRKGRVWDYPAGTLTFMSMNILEVTPGEKVHHSFLDDLESFLWLILWRTAAQLDDGVTHQCTDAKYVLKKLDCDNHLTNAAGKEVLAFACHGRNPWMTKLMGDFDNEWGLNPMLQCAIVKLGNLVASKFTHDASRLELECSPGETFLTIVNIIKEALALEPEN